MFRIGFGSDVHRLVEGKTLTIGGVVIESEVGADGHSDADVLLHAITDAMLGAIAAGDIGSHFPDTEERWLNAESSIFLRFTHGLVRSQGFLVENIDSTIDLESPKIRSSIEKMRTNIATALELDISQISVKAKTGEKVDAVGQGSAIRAQAVVMLRKA